MAVNIRNARSEDADVLAGIHIDSWKAAYNGLVTEEYLQNLDYKKRAERFRTSLTANSEDTFLVEENGNLLGFIMLGTCRDEDVDHTETGEIWGIYLAPRFWRQGIGSQLFHFGENILRKRGFKKIALWVFADNEQAIKFYEKLGFARDGTSKMLNPGKPLKAIRYRKFIQ